MKKKTTMTVKIPPRENKELTKEERKPLVDFFLLLYEIHCENKSKETTKTQSS